MDATGKAVKTKAAFRMDCAVAIRIAAKPERVWSLLTSAQELRRWNTNLERFEGTFAPGERLQLAVKSAPGRTFKPRITELLPAQRMVWSDGMAPMFRGVRTFTLTPREDGTTEFAMHEVFSGLMLPMIAGSLPDFGPLFEQYAQELKTAAEA